MSKYTYNLLDTKKMDGRMGWFYRIVLRMMGTRITKL